MKEASFLDGNGAFNDYLVCHKLHLFQWYLSHIDKATEMGWGSEELPFPFNLPSQFFVCLFFCLKLNPMCLASP